eukprot:scaffold1941_cov263-Pinguiococcus_pyrenoidosus.AAC.15
MTRATRQAEADRLATLKAPKQWPRCPSQAALEGLEIRQTRNSRRKGERTATQRKTTHRNASRIRESDAAAQ